MRLHLALIVDAGLIVRELEELCDVRARDECLTALASQDDKAGRRIPRRLRAGSGELPVHFRRHGISGGWPIEGDAADDPVSIVGDPFTPGHAVKAPARSSVSDSAASPSSSRIEAVCSPSNGGGKRTCCFVSDIFTGKPRARKWPSIGCGMSMTDPRASACS